MTGMKPFKTLLSRMEALEMIERNIARIGRIEEIPIESAGARILAENVVADFFVPPFKRSAMDGYAVRAEDTYSASSLTPSRLKLIGVQHAGELFEGIVKKGECVQVATGSPVPEGSDAVVMVEFTKLEGDYVEIEKPAYPSANTTPIGEDIKKGDTVIELGEILTPAKVGALAALNWETIRVYEKPRVAVFSTGSEIKPLGTELLPSQIYDMNSYTLTSIASSNGCEPVLKGIVPDDKESIRSSIIDAASHDIGVFSGGSSVGVRDLFGEIVEEMGEVLFHGLQVKPGKPTLFGIVQGTPIFGMPGYPTSCLSNAYIFLTPALRMMARLPPEHSRRLVARMSTRFVSSSGREQFLTVKVRDGIAFPAFKKSGTITSMVYADGYIILPVNLDVIEKGAEVEVTLFN
ncbi:MAG: molybdopterin-binding protein [Candidatus Bathyarchaeota archaeon]|nr:molybdopterin-binding protein [Candidatus Bathyarchaeota archaeon]